MAQNAWLLQKDQLIELAKLEIILDFRKKNTRDMNCKSFKI